MIKYFYKIFKNTPTFFCFSLLLWYTDNRGSVKIKVFAGGSENEYDGVALLRADGDGYKVYFRYSDSADLHITFDYELKLTTQKYEKVS